MAVTVSRQGCCRGITDVRSTLPQSPFFSQIIQRHNGRFKLSDDSHGPHAVGLNYRRLPEYLQAVAITEIWLLQRSNAPNVAGRTIQAAAAIVSGEWLDHEFWHALSIPSVGNLPLDSAPHLCTSRKLNRFATHKNCNARLKSPGFLDFQVRISP